MARSPACSSQGVQGTFDAHTPDDDLVLVEIDVLDPQPDAFHQTQAATVKYPGRNIPLFGKVGQELRYFLSPHLQGMAFAVEKDVSLDPIHICLFGADEVMSLPEDVPDLIKEIHVCPPRAVFLRMI